MSLLYPMPEAATRVRPNGLAPLLGWRRVLFTLCASVFFGLLLSPVWDRGPLAVITRSVMIGLSAMLVFGVLERWPRQLPHWMARWTWQVIGVALSVPVSTAVTYVLSTRSGDPVFWEDPSRIDGFLALSILGVLVAPWIALAALVRQKDALARHQQLAFDLQRSELERQALDARLHLLQAQVAPHFLFNTLANVQELVDTGSPQAPAVLRSLIAYLRASVPRLQEPVTTLGQEVQLVRAYLQLMQMRMPDRLQFVLRVDEAALSLFCPPMTLMTLVENAVRHGIDPGEEGGCIEVDVELRGGRCLVRVSDTGVGLQPGRGGLGTGLSTLRERLRLTFGDDAQLRLSAREGRGAVAELDLPALSEPVPTLRRMGEG
jgi:signal transduction histidine kinase